jgi:hypothetical protein
MHELRTLLLIARSFHSQDVGRPMSGAERISPSNGNPILTPVRIAAATGYNRPKARALE